MKNAFLFITLVLFFSCKKSITPEPVPTPPNSKTTAFSVVGKWDGSGIGLRDSVIFKSADSVRFNTEPGYRYHASADTIYIVCDDGNLAPEYAYFINAANTTLTLYPTLHHPESPFVYHRVY